MANVLKCLTNVLWTLVNHSKLQNQAYPQVFHDIDQSVETISTTDLTDWTELCPVCEQNKNRKNPLRWMQDVSYEPLMLCLSENPQASLDIFSQLHHHPAGSLHPSQGDKQE